MGTRIASTAAFAAALVAAGCASAQGELEDIAKDWCMTIRASQVMPVYPLTEDVRPGDVFLVPVSLARQAEQWKKDGYLPLDQHVARLAGLPYATFYAPDYMASAYSDVPNPQPGPWSKNGPSHVEMPRVAFPTYTFSVDRSSGLKIALPLQGVPVGLGLLGASQARGDVALKDAYTYGVDGASVARKLYAWWRSDTGVQAAMRSMATAQDGEAYLRVVTRVFLVGQVAVSISNTSTSGGDLGVGAAPEMEIATLAAEDPEKAVAAADAMKEVLATMSAPEGAAPGGRLQFVQASRRSVSMIETFDRPLVIGYVGFDVRIRRDGTLSAPIPSYTAVTGGEVAVAFAAPLAYEAGPLDEAYEAFLETGDGLERMRAFLRGRNVDLAPVDLLGSADPKHRELLQAAAAELGFPKPE